MYDDEDDEAKTPEETLQTAKDLGIDSENIEALEEAIKKISDLEAKKADLERQIEKIDQQIESAEDETEDAASSLSEDIEIYIDETTVDTSEFSDPEGNEDGPYGAPRDD